MNILTKEVNSVQSKITTVLSEVKEVHELEVKVNEVHDLEVKVNEVLERFSEVKDNCVNLLSFDVQSDEFVSQEVSYSSNYVNIVFLFFIGVLVPCLFWLIYV